MKQFFIFLAILVLLVPLGGAEEKKKKKKKRQIPRSPLKKGLKHGHGDSGWTIAPGVPESMMEVVKDARWPRP